MYHISTKPQTQWSSECSGISHENTLLRQMWCKPACAPSTLGPKAGGSRAQGQPKHIVSLRAVLGYKFKTSLRHVTALPKVSKTTTAKLFKAGPTKLPSSTSILWPLPLNITVSLNFFFQPSCNHVVSFSKIDTLCR